MAEQTRAAAGADIMEQAAERRVELRRPDVRWDELPKWAAAGGLAAVLFSAIGAVETFQSRQIVEGLLTFGYGLLFAIPAVTGFAAGRPPPLLEGMAPPRKGPRNLLAGMAAGIGAGLIVSLFVLLVQAIGVEDIRRIFLNVNPGILRLLTFDREGAEGLIRLTAGMAVAGAFGGSLQLLSRRWRGAIVQALIWLVVIGVLRDLVNQVFRTLKLTSVARTLLDPKGLSPIGAAAVLALSFAFYVLADYRRKMGSRVDQTVSPERRVIRFAQLGILLVVLLALPPLVGRFYSEVLTSVGIFVLMALGLNIVVGFAGLLDLGYVAFFAVGAYSAAVLTSPTSPRINPGLTLWEALPFIILAAVLAGIVVGTPVLRMRGDYLAIVTLGFGEIARILFLSDWFKPVFGGAQGILSIPNIPVAGRVISGPEQLYYPILGFCLLAAYTSWRLADSRIGRAWMAVREDERVAEVMGISIVTAKLSAFIIGAIIASFGGALFAVKIGSIFPHSFSILVSITVLVAIIVGGMGHIAGVVTGALVVVALPELLREFDEFRLLFYGALLIIMMLVKPAGLVPSAQRARELHEEDVAQDAWLRAGATDEDARAHAATGTAAGSR